MDGILPEDVEHWIMSNETNVNIAERAINISKNYFALYKWETIHNKKLMINKLN